MFFVLIIVTFGHIGTFIDVVIVAKNEMSWGNCDIGGAMWVNATFSDGINCDGTLTDWNAVTCNIRPKLTLNVVNCPEHHSIGKHII